MLLSLEQIEAEMLKYSDLPEIIKRMTDEELEQSYREVLLCRFDPKQIDIEIGH